MGDYARAEPLYRQALEIRKQGAGRGAPRLRHEPEQPGRAVPGARATTPGPSRSSARRLEIRKKALGENHPDYATSLNNLAGLYQAQGRLRPGRAALPPGAGDHEAGAGREPPRLRHEPEQPGRAVPGAGRLRPGRAALPPGAGDHEEGAGREAPRLRHEPEQPGRCCTRPGRLRPGRAALPPGAGDPEEGAGRGPPRLRHEPEQPGRAVPGHGRLRPGRAALPPGAGDSQEGAGRGTPTTPRA